jgi:hypothetical protein
MRHLLTTILVSWLILTAYAGTCSAGLLDGIIDSIIKGTTDAITGNADNKDAADKDDKRVADKTREPSKPAKSDSVSVNHSPDNNTSAEDIYAPIYKDSNVNITASQSEAIAWLKKNGYPISKDAYLNTCAGNIGGFIVQDIKSSTYCDSKCVRNYIESVKHYREVMSNYLALEGNFPADECLMRHASDIASSGWYSDLQIVKMIIQKIKKQTNKNSGTTWNQCRVIGSMTGMYISSYHIAEDYRTREKGLYYTVAKDQYYKSRHAEFREIFHYLADNFDVKQCQQESMNLLTFINAHVLRSPMLIFQDIVNTFTSKKYDINYAGNYIYGLGFYNKSGTPPLATALQLGDIEKMDYLIKKGADVNIPVIYLSYSSTRPVSLLYVAEQEGLLEIAQFLKSKGAKSIVYTEVKAPSKRVKNNGVYSDFIVAETE